MRRVPDLPELDGLASRLPFRLDAVDEAGAVFERWLRTPNDADEYVVALWTYCYVRRYFLVRFAREPSFTGGELEHVIDQAYERVERGRSDLREPSRYARWVVVVCRNTYVSFVARRSQPVELDRVAEPSTSPDELDDWHENAGLASAVRSAVERLPPFLRPYAEQRFLHGTDYEAIASAMGRDPATVRAYAHKALARLRSDRRLIRWLREVGGYEPPASGSEGETSAARSGPGKAIQRQ